MTYRRAGAAVLGLVLGVASLLYAQAGKEKEKEKEKGKAAADTAMVERLLAARREYQETLEALRAHYIAVGDIERARWAEEELISFHRIAKQAFDLKLDVPPPSLQALHNIPEANDLYRRALAFKTKSGFGDSYVDNQHRAEILFQQLLSKYPQSDKISDAAYQLGDIYEGRTYRQYARAAQYFERCFQWNSKTQFDARLRAAHLYERQLADRVRAKEIYQEITNHETDPRRLEEANRRLAELNAGGR
jgi:TolA-binding protein